MSASLVLVDPHEASREGLALLLGNAGWRVTGLAGTPSDGAALAERVRPDVTLIDADCAPPAALDLARFLRASGATRAVVLHAGDGTVAGFGPVGTVGAHAIARKSGSLQELLEVLHSALIPPPPAATAAGSPLPTAPAPRPTVLSRREQEIMELLSQGLTGEQVAQRLVLSIQTVKTHVRNAMLKLEACTRVHAIAIAIRRGYITGPGVSVLPEALYALTPVPAGHASVAA